MAFVISLPVTIPLKKTGRAKEFLTKVVNQEMRGKRKEKK
jgi:hypothetical protein